MFQYHEPKLNEQTVAAFKEKAIAEGAVAFIWFRERLEITFRVSEINEIDTPQWVQINQIRKLPDGDYLIQISVWDNDFLYSTEIALKPEHPFMRKKINGSSYFDKLSEKGATHFYDKD